MRQWLVLIGFVASGVLQTLCCCAMATTDDACHAPAVVTTAADSCCNALPEISLRADCNCGDHRVHLSDAVLYDEIKTSPMALSAPIPPLERVAGRSFVSFSRIGGDTKGHGPPPDPARLCCFLN